MERVHDFVERENAINNRPQSVRGDGPIHGDELRATAGERIPGSHRRAGQGRRFLEGEMVRDEHNCVFIQGGQLPATKRYAL
jgi:hypothetical protein